ncbi:MAG: hypothetical protein Q9182_007604, partial [Xanthomendoza sp. 2 TL-2023]
RWFTEEISATTRADLQTSIDLWCTELESRFRESPSVALSRLEGLRYTISDVRARKDPEDLIQLIVVNGNNAGTATTESAQVMMMYNHMDVQLRVLLAQPSTKAMISDFLQYVRAAKSNWVDLYKPYGNLAFVSTLVASLTTNTRGNPRYQPKASSWQNKSKDYKGKGKQTYHMEHDDEENQEPEQDSDGSGNSDGYNPAFYHGTSSDDYEEPEQPEVQEVGLRKPVDVVPQPAASQPAGQQLKRPPRPRTCEMGKADFQCGTKYHAHKKACQPDKWLTQATAGSVEGSTKSEDVKPVVVSSQAATGTHEPGYRYRGYQYARVRACIASPVSEHANMWLTQDVGCR